MNRLLQGFRMLLDPIGEYRPRTYRPPAWSVPNPDAAHHAALLDFARTQPSVHWHRDWPVNRIHPETDCPVSELRKGEK